MRAYKLARVIRAGPPAQTGGRKHWWCSPLLYGSLILSIVGPLAHLCWKHGVPWLAGGAILGGIMGALGQLTGQDEVSPAQRRAMRENCRKKGL